jgi:hypothetical protein
MSVDQDGYVWTNEDARFLTEFILKQFKELEQKYPCSNVVEEGESING